MSYAGLGHLAGAECGDMPDIGQEMGIDPRATAASTGARIVPTVWAQRALNAAGVRTTVDGIAGATTLRNLISAWTSMGRSGAQPVLVDAAHVAISPGFEGRLSLLRRVADPAGSTCGPCQWSACSSGTRTSSTSSTPSSTPSTPAGTPSTPISTQEPTLIEPGGRDFLGMSNIWPWAIGGAVLVGLGVWFLAGRGAGSGVRANRRRRRVRRNSNRAWPSDYTRSAADQGWKMRDLTPSQRHMLRQREEEELGFTGSHWGYEPETEQEEQEERPFRRRNVRRNYAYEHISHPYKYPVPVRKNRITPAQRRRMPKSAFVFPSRRAWPLNNARRAYAAIQYLRMGRVGSASDFNAIRNEVRRRYPDVWAIYGKNLTWERSKAAKMKRRSTKARRTSRGVRRVAANTRRTR